MGTPSKVEEYLHRVAEKRGLLRQVVLLHVIYQRGGSEGDGGGAGGVGTPVC